MQLVEINRVIVLDRFRRVPVIGDRGSQPVNVGTIRIVSFQTNSLSFLVLQLFESVHCFILV